MEINKFLSLLKDKKVKNIFVQRLDYSLEFNSYDCSTSNITALVRYIKSENPTIFCRENGTYDICNQDFTRGIYTKHTKELIGHTPPLIRYSVTIEM